MIGIYDDSPTARMVTARLLARAGYTSAELASYEQLLEVLPQLKLILMDLSLGEEDGRDVLQRLAQDYGGSPPIPVIAVTASASPELEEELRKHHFVDYLHKPFRPQDLYARVERWTSV